jgi:hypothetical protein
VVVTVPPAGFYTPDGVTVFVTELKRKVLGDLIGVSIRLMA